MKPAKPCPDCGDRFWIVRTSPQHNGTATPCLTCLPARIPEILKNYGIAEREIEMAHKAWNPKLGERPEIIDRWPEGKASLLSLIGPPGTGKTMAACQIVRRFAEQLKRCRWIFTPDLPDIVINEHRALDQHLRRELVVFDEFYNPDLPPTLARIIDDAFLKRFRNGGKTIITLNCRDNNPIQTWMQDVSPKVASRMKEGELVFLLRNDARSLNTTVTVVKPDSSQTIGPKGKANG